LQPRPDRALQKGVSAPTGGTRPRLAALSEGTDHFSWLFVAYSARAAIFSQSFDVIVQPTLMLLLREMVVRAALEGFVLSKETVMLFRELTVREAVRSHQCLAMSLCFILAAGSQEQ
jgi:hypothetical protein